MPVRRLGSPLLISDCKRLILCLAISDAIPKHHLSFNIDQAASNSDSSSWLSSGRVRAAVARCPRRPWMTAARISSNVGKRFLARLNRSSFLRARCLAKPSLVMEILVPFGSDNLHNAVSHLLASGACSRVCNNARERDKSSGAEAAPGGC